MKIFKDRKIYQGKYFRLIEREYLSNKKQKENWECVERKNGVFIFALTRKREVILERIFRVPLKSFVFELPAGICDKKGESIGQTARRELLEETGYKAKKLIPVFKWPLDPGILTNEGNLFFAPEAEFVREPLLEDSEEIEVYKVRLSKLFNFLTNPCFEDTKVDIKIFGAFCVLRQKGFL